MGSSPPAAPAGPGSGRLILVASLMTAACQTAGTAPEPAAEARAEMVRFLTEMPKAELHLHDPAQFESGYLVDLLYGVQQAGGYSRHDMVRFMVHAFDASFLPRSGKDAYLESVRAFAAANGAGR